VSHDFRLHQAVPSRPLSAPASYKAAERRARPMKRVRIGGRRWLPSRRLARRSRGLVLGGLWLRIITWSHASALDRELAGGADPMHSDELSLRVGQLRSAKRTARLACALRGAVELAARPPDHLTMPPSPVRRGEIQANRELLLALAERLDGCPDGVEGLAMVSLLISDGSSPIYHEDARRPLSVAAFEALVALERGDPQHH
jgi:hypothetical protein